MNIAERDQKKFGVRAAWYYYKTGMIQGDIAKRLGINRLRVNNILNEARKNGTVAIHVKGEDAKFMELEQKLKEKCGVFGIHDIEDASALSALGLHALQHRGQEGCGIVSFDGKNFHSEKRQGLVGDNFTNKEVWEKITRRC